MQKNQRRRNRATIFLLSWVVLCAACGKIPVAETDNESEANLMQDVLFSNQLNVVKEKKEGEKGGWVISIDEGWFGEDEADFATQMLNDYGLPRPKTTLLATTNAYGMEMPEETRKRQNREKEIQIENHIYTLPGVIRVSVILAQPENDPLSLQKTPPSATITIVQKEPEPKFTTDTVRNVAAGSVPNLTPDNIRVAVSTQTLREIPLERLRAQRHSNMLLALGGGTIALLTAALGIIWLLVKRRKKDRDETEPAQLTDGDNAQIEANERYALNAADEEEY